MNTLKGKTALITGGATRIGKEIALALAEREVNVIIHYNSTENDVARNLLEYIETRNVKAWAIQSDFSDTAETEHMFAKAKECTQRIDILINNASVFDASRITSVTPEEITRTININTYAPLTLSQLFAQQTDQGIIINILDTRIRTHDLAHAAYHLSKMMLYHITEMLAVELAPAVRVNAIAPGAILPPAGKDESYLNMLAQKIPLKRHGEITDITDAIIFLLTQTFLTGQVLYVDGGRNITQGIYGKQKG